MARLFVAVFAAVLAFAVAEDANHTIGDIKVSVLGRSGKILVGKVGGSRADDIVMEVDSVVELDSAGQATNNKVTTFASKDFSFSALNQTDVYEGIKAASFSFEATKLVSGAGDLTLSVYIFAEDGVITIDGENTTVAKGSVKTNLLIKDWPFKSAGGFLDVATIIKGKSGPTGAKAKKDERKNAKGKDSKGRKDRLFDLGDGATVALSEKVIVDGVATDMPVNFPAEKTTGNKQTFTFRLPQGTTMLYDPIIDSSGAGGLSSAWTASLSLSAAAAAVLVALLA